MSNLDEIPALMEKVDSVLLLVIQELQAELAAG
jgi:hypothetical protein